MTVQDNLSEVQKNSKEPMMLMFACVLFTFSCLIASGVSQLTWNEELKQHLNSITAKIDDGLAALKVDISALKVDMLSMKEELSDQITNFKQRHHDYIPDFADVLEKTSSSFSCKINGSDHFTTEHSIFHKGFVFTLGVQHSPCYQQLNPLRFNLFSADVIIRIGCPVNNFVLNATSFVQLRTGDEASTLGFVHQASRFWNGRLSGRLGRFVFQNGIMFGADEYLFEGVTQIAGMSGGATLNGIGYTGMVHAMSEFHNTHQAPHLAVVIPASTIFQAIATMDPAQKALLKTIAQCPMVQVLEIPTY